MGAGMCPHVHDFDDYMRISRYIMHRYYGTNMDMNTNTNTNTNMNINMNTNIKVIPALLAPATCSGKGAYQMGVRLLQLQIRFCLLAFAGYWHPQEASEHPPEAQRNCNWRLAQPARKNKNDRCSVQVTRLSNLRSVHAIV